jgi:glutathione S-transferase
MITVHHLNNSRSQRVLWLLEELGLSYEIAHHQRDPMTRLAPESLRAIHPLGKSPVIQDDRTGGLPIIESGAILDYLVETYGAGALKPAAGTSAALQYLQWMHFAEGSAMLPFLLRLYVGFLGEAGKPLHPRIESEITNHLRFMDMHFSHFPFACETGFTAADVQLTFVLEAAEAARAIAAYPKLDLYLARMRARDAYQRALHKGGPYKLGA